MLSKNCISFASAALVIFTLAALPHTALASTAQAPPPATTAPQSRGSLSPAPEAPTSPVFAEQFEQLRKDDRLEFSAESIQILAQVNRGEYGMDLSQLRMMGARALDRMGNPFFADTEEAYRKFLPDLEAAHEKAGLNVQLLLYRNLARWRLSELERLAPERERRKSIFEKGLLEAQTPTQVQQLIREHQDQAYVVRARQKLEDLLIASIRRDASWVKGVIPEVQVVEGKEPRRVTFRGVGNNRYGFITTEYPSDGPLPVLGFGGAREDVMGDGSVHRYKGETTLQTGGGAGYKIIGDADDSLAFLLLKEKGYVYLHGKGAVVYPDGKEVRFEGAAIPPPQAESVKQHKATVPARKPSVGKPSVAPKKND